MKLFRVFSGKVVQITSVSLAFALALVPRADAEGPVFHGAYHLHSYPICFYETEASAVAASQALWPQTMEVLEQIVEGKARRRTSILFASSRVAMVRSTLNHHRELLNLWPEVACIGRTGGSQTSQTARICREYVSTFIRSEIQHTELPDDTLVPICQNFLGQ